MVSWGCIPGGTLWPAGREGDPAPPLSPAEAASGTLCAVLGSSGQQRQGTTAEGPVEATRMMSHHLISHEEREELGLFSLQRRKLGVHINISNAGAARPFLVVPSNRTRSNGHHIKQEVPP